MDGLTILKRWAALIAVSLLLSATGAAMAETTVPEKDAAEITAALKGMQDAWNHHDMKAFASYMTDDVEWVNVVGMWWRGKAQVYKAHDTLHKTMFKDRELKDATEIVMRKIAPDVVVVTSVIPADGFSDSTGRVFPANRNVLTETFVHRDSRWLVAEGHNTLIDEQAAAHDPGK
jgi:uncharacterized protein (TIGR02246 family)